MKDYLRSIVEGRRSQREKRNDTREYLQGRMLGILQDQGVFDSWAFLGGTALRFLYRIPRYSEDLDFSMILGRKAVPFRKLIEKMKQAFQREGYQVELKLKDERTVQSAMVRFRGLPHEMGFSHRAEEVLAIKIDVDTNPPAGAGIQTTIIQHTGALNLVHHDQASLFAGKIHAILQRRYTKGRDLYDMFWYLTIRNWPLPNFDLLNAALKQSNWAGETINESNWKDYLRQRMDTIDWEAAHKDIIPFLENATDIQYVTKEICLQVLNQ